MILKRFILTGSFMCVFFAAFSSNKVLATSLVKLEDYSRIGNVRKIGNEIQVTTHTGSVRTSTLSARLGVNLRNIGTEGSVATYNLEPGKYKFNWSFFNNETRPGYDKFLVWNGEDLKEIKGDLRPLFNYRISPWADTRISTNTGILSFIALDTINRTGATTVKIRSLEKIPEPSTVLGLVAILIAVNINKKVRE